MTRFQCLASVPDGAGALRAGHGVVRCRTRFGHAVPWRILMLRRFSTASVSSGPSGAAPEKMYSCGNL